MAEIGKIGSPWLAGPGIVAQAMCTGLHAPWIASRNKQTPDNKFTNNRTVKEHLLFVRLKVNEGDPKRFRNLLNEVLISSRDGSLNGEVAGFRQVSLKEVVEKIKRQHKNAIELQNAYYHNELPLLLMSLAQGNSFFKTHMLMCWQGILRYGAIGTRGFSEEWLITNVPKEIVLDYSALTTLWSLYGEDWTQIVRAKFESIWISAHTLGLIFLKLQNLSHQGQAGLYQKYLQLKETILALDSKFRIHLAPQSENSNSLPTGDSDQVEKHLAITLNLPLLKSSLESSAVAEAFAMDAAISTSVETPI